MLLPLQILCTLWLLPFPPSSSTYIGERWSDCLVVTLFVHGHRYLSSNLSIDHAKARLHSDKNLTIWSTGHRHGEDRLECAIHETVCACTYCTALSLTYDTRRHVCARPFDIYDCPLAYKLADDSTEATHFEGTVQQMQLRDMHVLLDSTLRGWYVREDVDEHAFLSINTCTD